MKIIEKVNHLSVKNKIEFFCQPFGSCFQICFPLREEQWTRIHPIHSKLERKKRKTKNEKKNRKWNETKRTAQKLVDPYNKCMRNGPIQRIN